MKISNRDDFSVQKTFQYIVFKISVQLSCWYFFRTVWTNKMILKHTWMRDSNTQEQKGIIRSASNLTQSEQEIKDIAKRRLIANSKPYCILVPYCDFHHTKDLLHQKSKGHPTSFGDFTNCLVSSLWWWIHEPTQLQNCIRFNTHK